MHISIKVMFVHTCFKRVRCHFKAVLILFCPETLLRGDLMPLGTSAMSEQEQMSTFLRSKRSCRMHCIVSNPCFPLIARCMWNSSACMVIWQKFCIMYVCVLLVEGVLRIHTFFCSHACCFSHIRLNRLY